jgi:hypothetical protein
MVIQALIPEWAIKAFDVCILRGLARLDEYQLHTASMSPSIECQTGEFGPMVDPDQLWQRRVLRNIIQYACHARSRNRCIGLNEDAFPGTVIHHIQAANASAISLFVMRSRCRGTTCRSM